MGEGPDKLVFSTVAVGLISLITGELGGCPTLHFFIYFNLLQKSFFPILKVLTPVSSFCLKVEGAAE